MIAMNYLKQPWIGPAPTGLQFDTRICNQPIMKQKTRINIRNKAATARSSWNKAKNSAV
jgi:hypothetical protein